MIAIQLDSSSAEDLKSALRDFLPAVKASHRVEALARGVGFLTYASLLAAIDAGLVLEPDVNAFAAYLQTHGFAVDPNVLVRAFASAASRSVMRAEPRLTEFGFGIYQPDPTGRTRAEALQEAKATFEKDRQAMRGEFFAAAFLRSFALLERIPKTKTVRPRAGSYRLKHIAEKYPCAYPNGEQLGPDYVSNGALIAAAIFAGFEAKRGLDWGGAEHPNAEFNMSVSAIDDLDAECRPHGAVASTRRWQQGARRQRGKLAWSGDLETMRTD